MNNDVTSTQHGQPKESVVNSPEQNSPSTQQVQGLGVGDTDSTTNRVDPGIHDKPRIAVLTGKQIFDQLNKTEPPQGMSRKQASAFIKQLAEDATFFVHHNQSGGLPGGPILEPSWTRRCFNWLEHHFYSN